MKDNNMKKDTFQVEMEKAEKARKQDIMNTLKMGGVREKQILVIDEMFNSLLPSLEREVYD